MKRYDLVYSEHFSSVGIGENPNGTYCKFEEAQKIQNDLQEQLDQLSLEYSELFTRML